MAARAKIVETLPPELPAEVERAVRAAGALALARLTRVKLGAAARKELEQRLVAAGLERSTTVVRVPLGQQILGLLQGGGRVALKDLPKRVKGGARKEMDAAVDRLVEAGQARVVVRTQVEVLVGGADRALTPAEVTALAAAHAALGKVLKKVKAKGRPRSILREDLAALLGPMAMGEAHTPSGAAPRQDTATAPVAGPSAIVGESLRRMAVLGLVRVPELVRALDGKVALADVHRALIEADDAGVIELRPEAGGEFLAEEDARLCPPGPRGTVFSYAALVRP